MCFFGEWLIALPPSTLSNEGSQHFHNWSVVARRILRDPLEGVDTAQSDSQIIASQLLDGPDEPFGDLPFETEMQFLPVAFEGDLQLLSTEAQLLTVARTRGL